MSNVTTRAALPEWPVRTLRATVVLGPDAPATAEGSDDALTLGSADANALVLTDPMVSRYHLEVVTTPRGFRVRDVGSTNGTFVGAVRIADAVVPPGTVLTVGGTSVRLDDGSARLVELFDGTALGAMRGETLAMRRLMARLAKVAATPSTVLLVGESGTGKELAARAIHEGSSRVRAPFEIVDCAALVPNLVASELFGHERGAFTGADRAHVGALERAQGGTVFLDEIGELPPSIQPVLLGALERRRIRRVGGRVDLPIDVRVVSATHRDLRAEVNASTFRLDLYYRLAVVVLELPPLRERRGDLRLLVEHFLHESGREGHAEAWLPPDFLATIASYSFPGNLRELRNLVESAVATGELPPIAGASASASPAQEGGAARDQPYRTARDAVLAKFEKDFVVALLDRCGGNLARAAREAQMDRSHLTQLAFRHGLRSRDPER